MNTLLNVILYDFLTGTCPPPPVSSGRNTGCNLFGSVREIYARLGPGSRNRRIYEVTPSCQTHQDPRNIYSSGFRILNKILGIYIAQCSGFFTRICAWDIQRLGTD